MLGLPDLGDLGFIVALVIVALLFWLLWWQLREREWRALARDLGLTFQWRGWEPLLTGPWDGFRVSWQSGRTLEEEKKWWTEWTVDGQDTVPHELVLNSQLMPSGVPWSGGDPPLGMAALDSQTRGLLAMLQTSGVSVQISAGTAQALTRTRHRVDDQRAIRQTFTNLVRLMRGLTFEAADVPQRLARHAHEDPDGEWRLRSLLCLQDSFPGAPAAREASRVAATAGQPAPMRLAGAAFLGAEGVRVLEELAADRSVDRDVRRAAALHRVLASPVPDALRLITRFRWLWSLGNLPQPLADRVAAVTDSAREPVLLELVATGASSLQVAAVRALARIGTRHAMERLRACATSTDPALSRAAQETIAAIQSRLGDVAGRLSVAAADDGVGGLTAADPTTSGGLSVPQGHPTLAPTPQRASEPARPEASRG